MKFSGDLSLKWAHSMSPNLSGWGHIYFYVDPIGVSIGICFGIGMTLFAYELVIRFLPNFHHGYIIGN